MSTSEDSSVFDYFFQPLDLPPPPPLIFDSEVVPYSLVENIAPILRVAYEVEASNPRVAYLCRFYAWEKSHKQDPTSSGQGVRQFKTALLQRLERENEPSMKRRAEKNDALEMLSFYKHFYSEYIQALQNADYKTDWAQVTKVYQTVSVLFEVMKAVNATQAVKTEESVTPANEHYKLLKSPLLPPPVPPPPPSINTRESIFDTEVVPSSLVEIAPILRVANEVAASNPRVAYLCRIYAFVKTRKQDPTSSGRGVHQFKTVLLQRIEREAKPSFKARAKKSDALETKSFYQQYCSKYLEDLRNADDKTDHPQLTQAYQTISILFKVTKALSDYGDGGRVCGDHSNDDERHDVANDRHGQAYPHLPNQYVDRTYFDKCMMWMYETFKTIAPPDVQIQPPPTFIPGPPRQQDP